MQQAHHVCHWSFSQNFTELAGPNRDLLRSVYAMDSTIIKSGPAPCTPYGAGYGVGVEWVRSRVQSKAQSSDTSCHMTIAQKLSRVSLIELYNYYPFLQSFIWKSFNLSKSTVEKNVLRSFPLIVKIWAALQVPIVNLHWRYLFWRKYLEKTKQISQLCRILNACA